MRPDLEWQVVTQRAEELRRAGEAARLVRKPRASALDDAEEVLIRAATSADACALAALAALDGVLRPIGPTLVAEVAGTIQAALPLDEGRAFADPFRRTADLVALLEARARQLGRERQAEPRRGVIGWLTPAALRRHA